MDRNPTREEGVNGPYRHIATYPRYGCYQLTHGVLGAWTAIEVIATLSDVIRGLR